MIMTHHALARWSERFGHLLPDEEWAAAKRVNQKMKRHILERCISHRNQIRGSHDTYYRLSPRNVVFVVAPGEVIVTVFRFRK